jgi:hypothetical protein
MIGCVEWGEWKLKQRKELKEVGGVAYLTKVFK